MKNRRRELQEAVDDEEALESFDFSASVQSTKRFLQFIEQDAEDCTDCSRRANRGPEPVSFSRGNPFAGILILERDPDVPGEMFDKKPIDELVKDLGMIDGDYYHCYAVKCWAATAASTADIAECHAILLAQLNVVRPNLIIQVGDTLVSADSLRALPYVDTVVGVYWPDKLHREYNDAVNRIKPVVARYL